MADQTLDYATPRTRATRSRHSILFWVIFVLVALIAQLIWLVYGFIKSREVF